MSETLSYNPEQPPPIPEQEGLDEISPELEAVLEKMRVTSEQVDKLTDAEYEAYTCQEYADEKIIQAKEQMQRGQIGAEKFKLTIQRVEELRHKSVADFENQVGEDRLKEVVDLYNERSNLMAEKKMLQANNPDEVIKAINMWIHDDSEKSALLAEKRMQEILPKPKTETQTAEPALTAEKESAQNEQEIAENTVQVNRGDNVMRINYRGQMKRIQFGLDYNLNKLSESEINQLKDIMFQMVDAAEKAQESTNPQEKAQMARQAQELDRQRLELYNKKER